jgi:hypothetical protein
MQRMIADTGRIDPRLLRVLFPKHTAKSTSTRFRRAIETARKWLIDGVPYEQRRAVADVIDAEVPRLQREIDELLEIRDWCRSGEAGD